MVRKFRKYPGLKIVPLPIKKTCLARCLKGGMCALRTNRKVFCACVCMEGAISLRKGECLGNFTKFSCHGNRILYDGEKCH